MGETVAPLPMWHLKPLDTAFGADGLVAAINMYPRQQMTSAAPRRNRGISHQPSIIASLEIRKTNSEVRRKSSGDGDAEFNAHGGSAAQKDQGVPRHGLWAIVGYEASRGSRARGDGLGSAPAASTSGTAGWAGREQVALLHALKATGRAELLGSSERAAPPLPRAERARAVIESAFAFWAAGGVSEGCRARGEAATAVGSACSLSLRRTRSLTTRGSALPPVFITCPTK